MNRAVIECPDSCTRAIEGPAYQDNCVSYADEGGNW
jgi:hypothetical protein